MEVDFASAFYLIIKVANTSIGQNKLQTLKCERNTAFYNDYMWEIIHIIRGQRLIADRFRLKEILKAQT